MGQAECSLPSSFHFLRHPVHATVSMSKVALFRTFICSFFLWLEVLPVELWGIRVSFNSGFLGVYAQQWDCWVVWQFYFQFFKESPHCSP